MNKPATFSDLQKTAEHHHCVHPWADLWINAAGHVTCCPQNRSRFGNIHQHSIEQLWNSDAAQTVRRLVAEGDYVAAGCEIECPYLRGRKSAPAEPPPANELINLDFELPTEESDLQRNIATVIADYSNKAQILSGLPIYVDTQPVLRCNADCIMCPQPHMSDMRHSEEILQKLETLRATAKVFRWQGGEVFSSKRFFHYLHQFDTTDNPDLVKYVITNGSLLTEERIAALTEHDNPVFFLLSIDGVQQSTFEKIRLGLSYRQVMATLHFLASAQATNRSGRKLVRWNYVVMNSTLAEMRTAIDLADDLKVDLNFAALQGDYPEENIFRYPLHDIDTLLDRFADLATYSSSKSIQVDGLSGLSYRLRQHLSEPHG
ncbi:radical SAM/SPASM domain-containing protein [Methylomonas sp. 11b]|uniref:radical SAM/SPASM domain-containing protein n=1 Tax=Methylomonas sp. 11b TaxID=1168169 RepID=UPI00047E75F0|nr:radical SAM/SPASM domain-containing protein [Methylomonas sp. 11b]